MITATDKHLIALSDIHVGERVRSDEGDIEALAISILKYGQLQPLILDQDNNLIAGKRRYEALVLNQSASVWVSYQHEIDELKAVELEIEENIRRKQFTAAEEIQGIARLDAIRNAQDPNWTQGQTAALAGLPSPKYVSEANKYSKMIDLFPELKDAKSVRQLKSWADHKAASINRVIEVRDNSIDYAKIENKIILGDSVDVIRTIPSGSFHAIITDPPFGIDYDERRAGSKGSLSDYEDSSESYERLLSMAPDLFRVLRSDGWLVWFLGVSWYERAKQVFRESGFTVDEIPVVWDRSEGRCYTIRPDRYFGRGYDIALHCLKGNPQVVQRGKPNIIRVKPVEVAETQVERPTDLYAELIRRLTVPGEIVADFFVGSGSCPAAAASLGRDYFGIEQNAERRAYAIKKIRAFSPEEK